MLENLSLPVFRKFEFSHFKFFSLARERRKAERGFFIFGFFEHEMHRELNARGFTPAVSTDFTEMISGG